LQNIVSEWFTCLTEKPRLVGRGLCFPELIIAGWVKLFCNGYVVYFQLFECFWGLTRKFGREIHRAAKDGMGGVEVLRGEA
jgi:hypothetical protein